MKQNNAFLILISAYENYFTTSYLFILFRIIDLLHISTYKVCQTLPILYLKYKADNLDFDIFVLQHDKFGYLSFKTL